MYNYTFAFIKHLNISFPIYSAKLEVQQRFHQHKFAFGRFNIPNPINDITAELYVSDIFLKYYHFIYDVYKKEDVTLIDFENNTALLLQGVNFKSFNNMDNKLDLIVDYYTMCDLNELDNSYIVQLRKYKLEKVMKGW